MLKHGTGVVQRGTSVCLDIEGAAHSFCSVFQANGNQQNAPERSEDCRIAVEAINAHLNAPVRYAVLCIPKVGPEEESRYRVYIVLKAELAAKCYRNALEAQGFVATTVKFTTVDELAHLLMGD